MGHRPSVYLTDERYQYVKELADSDDFDSQSEAIGEAIDLLREQRENEDRGEVVADD